VKTVCLSHLYIKTMILPRQARDKHRETSNTDYRCVFSGENLALLDEFIARYSELFEWVRPKAGAIAFIKFRGPMTSEDFGAQLATLVRKTASFLEFSLCLSRACLGKMIVFIHKWRKNAVFRRGALASSRRTASRMLSRTTSTTSGW
jgi:hypothetical protein